MNLTLYMNSCAASNSGLCYLHNVDHLVLASLKA